MNNKEINKMIFNTCLLNLGIFTVMFIAIIIKEPSISDSIFYLVTATSAYICLLYVYLKYGKEVNQ